MKSRSLRTAATAAVCGAVLATVPGSEVVHGPVDPVPVTAAEAASNQQKFGIAVADWKSHGVDLGTQLAIVSGPEEYDCFGETVSSGDSSLYCPLTNTVVITARTIHDTEASGNLMVSWVIIDHEIGHAVQDEEGQLSMFDSPKQELGATCLAGVTMRRTVPQVVLSQLLLSELIDTSSLVAGTDDLHGTSAQQQTALMHGFTTQDCSVYGNPIG